MAGFEEILDKVRLALTRASPADIRGLLEGLVEERIISEAYSKTLRVCQVDKMLEAEQFSLAKQCGPWWSAQPDVSDRSQAKSAGELGWAWPADHLTQEFCQKMQPRGPPTHAHYLTTAPWGPGEETEGLLGKDPYFKVRSGADMANLENEDRLEQVEEAARRIAVPLWQHWETGQRMLRLLTEIVSAASDGRTVCRKAQSPAFEMEEETECTLACQMLDFYAEECDPWVSAYDGGANAGPDMEDFISAVADVRRTHMPADVRTTQLDENIESKENGDFHWGTKMKELDLDPNMFPDDRTLPDDLSEFLNEEHLRNILDPDVLFGDFEVDDLGDILLQTELHNTDSHHGAQKHKSTNKIRRKRQRAPPSQKCTDEHTMPGPKRQKAAEEAEIIEAQPPSAVNHEDETGLEQNHTVSTGFSTPPQRILHVHPSIQLIAMPDLAGCQVVQTLRLSPPVIGLPKTSASPTYILVPAPSPPCKLQMPPLSPMDGALPPVQMSSSPPGSLSDSASRNIPPPCASPVSSEISPCKASPASSFPTVADIRESVKNYIRETKDYMSQICQDLEPGRSLSSHYVDVPVIRRELLRPRKNMNKCLNNELVMMGDMDQQKYLLSLNEIFGDPNRDKPKRYTLLLGKAGMGKTTLIRKLCLDWSRDSFKQFDFVFVLDGKALLLTEASYSLQTLLLKHSSFAPSCADPKAVYARIIANPKRVLLIFDGFDGLRDYETLFQTQEKDLTALMQRNSKLQTYTVRQLFAGILQRVLLPGCSILLSTRPRGTATQLLRRVDSFLEVCGFMPAHVESYFSQYFTDPALKVSTIDCLKNCNYLYHLCWNPGLCRLVCLVLEQSQSLDDLPRTLTGLCHQVLCLKMQENTEGSQSLAEAQTPEPMHKEDEPQTGISTNVQEGLYSRNTKSNGKGNSRCRTKRTRRSKGEDVDMEETDGDEHQRRQERELLAQLSSLAWEGVKSGSSMLPLRQDIPSRIKAFGLRTGIFASHQLKTRRVISCGEKQGGVVGREEKQEQVGDHESMDMQNNDICNILFWANPFLQSYLAGVHLSLSRSVTDRTFLQALPFQPIPRARRRPPREELELTQRFTVGLLFHVRTKLHRLCSMTDTAFSVMVSKKQGLATKHLQGLLLEDLSPVQVLEVCHYAYEASFTHSRSRSGEGANLSTQLAENLPRALTFRGSPLTPPDAYVVQDIVALSGTADKCFSLDLEESGIRVSGLGDLVGLSNIDSFRACIADVIALWEEMEQNGESGLLHQVIAKFTIDPLKATQVCHVEHLAKLVNIHTRRRLSDRQSDSILAEGVPAVLGLHKLELELGPQNGPLALPKLWELLPGLQKIRHLDLENNKIGDEGAEELTDALLSLPSLEILNLSQNCIGDHGVRELATTLQDLPRLHSLSLYSNVIADEGAQSLADALPRMVSLTDLDVKFNKLTDVGAQSLGASLQNCTRMRTLRMWNQFIPYGVFERLQQQDPRILSY